MPAFFEYGTQAFFHIAQFHQITGTEPLILISLKLEGKDVDLKAKEVAT